MSSTAFQAWNGFENPLTSWFQNGPAAPGSFAGAAGDQSVVLTWTAPASDSPVLYYVVSGDNGLANQIIPAGTLTATYSGLTNGTLYTFGIYAVSAVCAGSSATTTATPAAFTYPTNVGLPSTVLTTWSQAQQTTVAQDFTAPNSDPGYTLSNANFSDYHNIFDSSVGYSGNLMSVNVAKVSVVAKKGSLNFLGLGRYNGKYAIFDLNSGTVTDHDGTSTATITAVPGAPGYYFCELVVAVSSKTVMFVSCGNTSAAAKDGAIYPSGGVNAFSGTLQVYHAAAYN